VTPDIINVHIHHLRRRLAPFGIGIVTEYGYGYRLCLMGADTW
jgi:DNA-binding response OmpR family regulator